MHTSKNVDIFLIGDWIQSFNLFVLIPIWIITSIFPIYFAVQNRYKRWIWGISIASIILDLQGVLALGVIFFPWFSNFRNEFLQWRANK
jgi:hypothetical protein